MVPSRRNERILDLLERVYRGALVSYPAAFRRAVGHDMAEVYRDLCAQRLASAGFFGLLLYVWRSLPEALANGLGERWARLDSRRRRRPAQRSPLPPTRLSPRSSPGDRLLSSLVQDLKYALRTLRKQPLFSLLAVVMLALGIAGNTAIFGLFNGMYLRPLPFPDADRLVDVDETAPRWDLEYVSIAYPDFDAWRADNRTFEAIAVFDAEPVNLALQDEAIRVDAVAVSHEMMEVLGIEPVVGRDFGPDDDVPGAPAVTLLGHALWRDHFGSDPRVLGSTVNIDSLPHTVIGILPEEAIFVGNTEGTAGLWRPLATDVTENPGSWYLKGIGRLSPGVTAEHAEEDLTRVHKNLIETREVNEVTSPVVAPIIERYLGDFRFQTSALLGAVGLVLIMACANIAGLMLARSTGRTREIGIRAALGAGRRRLVRQLLTESVVVAVAGATVGTLGGLLSLRALTATAPEALPRWIRFDVDARFLAFTVAITGGAALVFGLAPALQASRSDVQRVLRAVAARASASRGQRLTLNALVIGEIALAVVLLVGAGLFIRGFIVLSGVDPGFRPDKVLTYRIALPDAKYGDDPARVSFFEEHVRNVAALPGVEVAAATTSPPLGSHTGFFFEAEGAPERQPDEPNPVVLLRAVVPGYFQALGITLQSGRVFTGADGRDEENVQVIVNETFVRHFWPEGGEAVGRRVRFAGGESWMTVVGVTRDVKHYGLDTEMRPGVYVPQAWYGAASMAIVARTAVDPVDLVAPARELLRRQDSDIPMFAVSTMSRNLRDSLWPQRASSWLFAIFAGVALLLAVGGIYGVVSYAVGQRTHELGIRMALGAQRGQVLRHVLRQGTWLIGLGVVFGLGGALAVARGLASLLFGVSPTDPIVFAAITATMIAVALAANLVPARRAAAIDPMRALRGD